MANLILELVNDIYEKLGKEIHPSQQHHWANKDKYWLCNRLITAAKMIEQLQAENKKLKEIIPIAYEAICTGDLEASDKAISLIENLSKP